MASVFMDDGQVKVIHGHVIDALRMIPSESISCVCTSPPYWSLRSYGTEPQVWGGDPSHEHEWGGLTTPGQKESATKSGRVIKDGYTHAFRNGLTYQDHVADARPASGACCPCGAWRGELGHEPTPQMFVQHLVEVFREVRRVLKPDGVCFVNLGDSYTAGKTGRGESEDTGGSSRLSGGRGVTSTSKLAPSPVQRKAPEGMKPKSLVLIPERFALAMADDGWYVRSRIAWCKRAPMPESVRDRPTSAWEHVWMFTRSATYYWDADAVREQPAEHTLAQIETDRRAGLYETGKNKGIAGDNANPQGLNAKRDERFRTMLNPAGRNMWNWWLLSPDPEPLAHFATFPREIPRRCIAAATSERGECPHCGKSWVRTTDRKYVKSPWHSDGAQMRKRSENGAGVNGWAGMPRVSLETTTTGWQPQCQCPPHEPRPSTVLDPFCGSGTTMQVARSMGRYSIGIDLSETYLRDIALRKNAQMGLMLPSEPVA